MTVSNKNKNWKKISAWLCIFAVCLSLTGCGHSQTVTTLPEQTKPDVITASENIASPETDSHTEQNTDPSSEIDNPSSEPSQSQSEPVENKISSSEDSSADQNISQQTPTSPENSSVDQNISQQTPASPEDEVDTSSESTQTDVKPAQSELEQPSVESSEPGETETSLPPETASESEESTSESQPSTEIVPVGEAELKITAASDSVPKGNPEMGVAYAPKATGASVASDKSGIGTIDYSNASQGYIMAKYNGSAAKAKLMITGPDGFQYQYTLYPKSGYQPFGMSGGNGSYKVEFYENVTGNQYALLVSQKVSVNLENSFLPFLYPNQWVNFKEGDNIIKKATELAGQSSGEAEMIQNMYNYVVKSMVYDTAKAANPPKSYICNIDQVVASGKGICTDYAATLTAMLRSQNIPARLEVGYVGDIYHAWVRVYSTKDGSINQTISLKANTWTLLDPTFAASLGDASLKQFVGDGSGYQLQKVY